jgi:hypothetical protein
MIEAPTVFILGAGASMPYGFPSGSQLVGWICQNPPAGFDDYLTRKFVDDLRESDQLSVDAFLEHRPEFLEIGKFAIATRLIQSERHENLFPQKDWYSHLLNRMDAPFADFGNNRVGFITFNYDRSLEHYLFTALCKRYGKSSEEVGKLLRGILFIHVHGQLGYLPWQNCKAGETREYHPECSPEKVDIARRGIKVISEDMEKTPEFDKARELMEAASKIFFLGFGYHPVNMKRLKVPFADGIAVCGTCYGMTEAEKDIVLLRNRASRQSVPGLELSHTGNKIIDFLRSEPRFLSD